MTTKTTLTRIALITALGALLAAPVFAQGRMGMGGGQCMQAGQNADNMGQCAGQGQGQGRGMGRGQGKRGMGMQNNARGSALMTPEERTAHQVKMRAVKTFDECTQVQGEQRKLMETRAKDKGITLPTPRRNACENLKTRGLIK